jgi:hypothetical protein
VESEGGRVSRSFQGESSCGGDLGFAKLEAPFDHSHLAANLVEAHFDVSKLFGMQGDVPLYASERFLESIELDSMLELRFAYGADVGPQRAKMLEDQIDGFI